MRVHPAIRRHQGVGGLAGSVSLALAGVLAFGTVVQGASEQSDPVPGSANQTTGERFAAVAAVLGGDAESVFRFVADEIRYEPYSGALRGAEGAFASRAGNSVDQALLLAALLDRIGIASRFAVGEIDPATASRIVEDATVDAAAYRDDMATAIFGRLGGDGEPAPDLPSVDEYVPFEEADVPLSTVDQLDAELIDTLALIETSLRGQGRCGCRVHVDASGRGGRHVWVQASIDGEWVDLDPSLPGIAMAASLAEGALAMESIPPARFHTITIEVITETLQDCALVTKEPLRVEGTSVELADVAITFTNVGSEAVPGLTRAFEQVLGVISYRPVLFIDGQRVAGDEMLIADPAADSGGGLGGDFFDAGSATDETTAQWLELTIDSPRREAVTIRRTIFDRVGDSTRAAGSVDVDALAELPGVDLEGDGSFEPAPLHTFWWLVVSTGTPSLGSPIIDLADDAADWTANVPYAHGLAMALADADHAEEFGVRSFADAPNVAGVVASVRTGPDGSPMLEGAIDLWHRSRGVAPVSGVEAVAMPAAVPGVLAHVVERMVGSTTQADDTVESPISVGAVFAAAHDQDIDVRVVATASELAEVEMAESRHGRGSSRAWKPEPSPSSPQAR